ncbi:MAG: hypothetical protein KatS3mg018_0561 [Fimbriimonadales bacterium]|nr:MAG: hypothetical protein KatS3mg018_0561 [Fimbriimonadales bacterium]
MRVVGYVRSSYRSGWGVLDTVRDLTLTVSLSRAGWTGDVQWEYPKSYPLGAELQAVDASSGATLWLGKIVERSWRSTERLYRYRLRGICEHFLDLPFPFGSYDYQRTRTGSAQSVWEYHLARHLRYHTPRYQPVYNLSLASLTTRDYQLRTVRDAYKLYQSLTACKISPELLAGGRVRMHLDPLPLTRYALPRDAVWEVSESILESATRISLSEPAKQMVKDRRITNPEYWELVVPAGATASVSVQDANERGYLGAYATRLDVEITQMVWVGLRYRETLRSPKNSQGQYLPLAIGWRARGENASVRLNFRGMPTSAQGYNSLDTYVEQAYLATPTTDDFWFAIEAQPTTPTLPATLIIDGVYCAPAASAGLDERDYQPHLPISDQIPSYLTGGIVATINAVSTVSSGVYDLVAAWGAFPSGLSAGTPLQVLQNSGYLNGTVVSRQSATTLRVQVSGGAPQAGDVLYVRYGAGAEGEYQFDALYAQLDAPVALDGASLAGWVDALASPQARLTAQIRLGASPLPVVGQAVAHPESGALLPIYEVELPIVAGRLEGVRLQAGSPELTMRSLMREIRGVGRRVGV